MSRENSLKAQKTAIGGLTLKGQSLLCPDVAPRVDWLTLAQWQPITRPMWSCYLHPRAYVAQSSQNRVVFLLQ